MNARQILNSAREGLGDPELIRWALVEAGEMDGGCFEVALPEMVSREGQNVDDLIAGYVPDNGADETSISPGATSKHPIESEHLYPWRR